jgi:indole-3-glycerol phosphate synthase
MSTILDQILADKRAEVDRLKKTTPLASLMEMIPDAPPLRDFKAALDSGFGLIAEIKRKSPSIGQMREANVAAAISAYEASPVVRAISVLTDEKYFGMSMARLKRIKLDSKKPILRKDFIFDEYQIFEARAYGADAILLMACLLDKTQLAKLFSVASELGLQVLFESHTAGEIETIPAGAKIHGINSRNFMSKNRGLLSRYNFAKVSAYLFGHKKDLSTDLSTFDLVKGIPAQATKVAESGIHPEKIAEVRDKGFDAVLVGTALLRAEIGIQAELKRFEDSILRAKSEIPRPSPSMASG